MEVKRGISCLSPAPPHCGVADAPGSAGSSQAVLGNALVTSNVVYQAEGKTRHFTTRNSHGMQTQGLLSDGRGYVLVKNPFRSRIRKYTQDSVFQGLLLCMFINGCQFRRLSHHTSFIKIKKEKQQHVTENEEQLFSSSFGPFINH